MDNSQNIETTLGADNDTVTNNNSNAVETSAENTATGTPAIQPTKPFNPRLCLKANWCE